MTILRVFKSAIPSINYIFPSGKVAAFQFGVYRTDIKDEIEHLENEIRLGHPQIFIDEAEREIDSELVDPIHALRAKIIAEYVAQQEAASNPDNDMGKSDQSAVKPANSRDIAAAAAGGSGASLMAAIAKK